MTATEELRAELTRRGVKWKRMRGHKHDGTEWHDASGAHVSAVQEYTWDGTEWPEGKLHVNRAPACLTPEQAIETTMGRGECHNVEEYPFIWSFTCSECGVHSITEGRGFNFCPNCGRKVVTE